jgi:hypothetical protein
VNNYGCKPSPHGRALTPIVSWALTAHRSDDKWIVGNHHCPTQAPIAEQKQEIQISRIDNIVILPLIPLTSKLFLNHNISTNILIASIMDKASLEGK